MRRRFLRRVGLAVAFFFGLMIAANALAVLVLARAFRVGHHRGFVPAGAILGLVLLAGFVAVGRTVRRVAAPVGDVMDAADRVSSGDYTARSARRRKRRRHTPGPVGGKGSFSGHHGGRWGGPGPRQW